MTRSKKHTPRSVRVRKAMTRVSTKTLKRWRLSEGLTQLEAARMQRYGLRYYIMLEQGEYAMQPDLALFLEEWMDAHPEAAKGRKPK